MRKHASPAYKTEPAKAWAVISDDVPPQIWEIGWHKDNFERQDLRHIRVMVIPVNRKPPKRRT